MGTIAAEADSIQRTSIWEVLYAFCTIRDAYLASRLLEHSHDSRSGANRPNGTLVSPKVAQLEHDWLAADSNGDAAPHVTPIPMNPTLM